MTPARKADTLGTILAAILLTAFIFISAALIGKIQKQDMIDQAAAARAHAAAIRAEKDAANEAQQLKMQKAEIARLKAKIQRQHAHAHPIISSRSDDNIAGISVGPWEDFTATWYDLQPGINGNGSGITATGTHCRDNWTISVDPRIIPLGSTVEVRFSDGSTHIYHAEDTGSAIIGNRVDIFTSSEAQALANGRQEIQLRVISGGAGQ